MHASYHCNDNAIQFPCPSLFDTALELGMRWNITLSSNSHSLEDKMPSTLPSLTQYGFISMTSYLISQVTETTHGQKLEYHCWLNWLDYCNVLTTFHIGHFAHSYRERVDFAEDWIILELLLRPWWQDREQQFRQNSQSQWAVLCFFAQPKPQIQLHSWADILHSTTVPLSKTPPDSLTCWYFLPFDLITLEPNWASLTLYL